MGVVRLFVVLGRRGIERGVLNARGSKFYAHHTREDVSLV